MQSSIKLAQLGKKAPIITKYMGRRALQDIKGFTNMGISLDFRSAIVRVAIMAGTLQPNPHNQWNKGLAMQSHPVHYFIHDKCSACHIPRIFQYRNKKV